MAKPQKLVSDWRVKYLSWIFNYPLNKKYPHLTQFHVILIFFSFSLASSLVEMTLEVLCAIILGYILVPKSLPQTHTCAELAPCWVLWFTNDKPFPEVLYSHLHRLLKLSLNQNAWIKCKHQSQCTKCSSTHVSLQKRNLHPALISRMRKKVDSNILLAFKVSWVVAIILQKHYRNYNFRSVLRAQFRNQPH